MRLQTHKSYLLSSLLIGAILGGCGNDDSEQKSAASSKTASEPASSMPAESTPTPAAKPAMPDNGVIYEEEIYKNWPHTEAPPAAEAAPVATETPVTEMPEKKVEDTMAEAKTVAAVTTNNASASTSSVDGSRIYNTYCAICHKLGMNAAPKYGNKALWAKRIAQGRDTVYSHALNGLRGMPPRGGFAQLTDDEVKAGVDYMVNAAGGWGK